MKYFFSFCAVEVCLNIEPDQEVLQPSEFRFFKADSHNQKMNAVRNDKIKNITNRDHVILNQNFLTYLTKT